MASGTAIAAALLSELSRARAAGVFATHLHLLDALPLGGLGLARWRMEVRARRCACATCMLPCVPCLAWGRPAWGEASLARSRLGFTGAHAPLLGCWRTPDAHKRRPTPCAVPRAAGGRRRRLAAGRRGR